MFHSCESALHWAYNVSARPIVKMAAINTMRGASTGMANELIDNLTVQDRHGQAAMIIGMVDQLHDPVAREFVKARFGRMVSQDELRLLVFRCCGWLGVGEERHDAVYRIVRGYFGPGNVSLRTIRRSIGCRHRSAIVTKRELFDGLESINKNALAELSGHMERKGLIRG